jgi:hypothetical protein
MPKHKRTISYNTHPIENARQWDVEVNIPRQEIGRVCQALHLYTSKMLGASFYYPDPIARTTTCRYEWFAGSARQRFFYKLGLMFAVNDEPLRKIRAYVGYGDRHPAYGTIPPEDRETTSHLNSVLEVLKSIDGRGPKSQARHWISYIQAPHGFYVGKHMKIEALRAMVLPTVLVGKENVGVSPIIFTTDEDSGEEGDDSIDRSLEVSVLLTVATGSLFKPYFLQWQKRQKPKQVVATIDPVPELASLFPPKRWRAWFGSADDSFAPRLEGIVKMFDGLSEELRTPVRNAMFAYRSGLEMLSAQPTLASVAFVAALGFLAKRKQCAARIECEACGPLDFRHDLVGERQSLFNALADLLALKAEAPDFKELNTLLTRVYQEQRSAYVHGARLRHRELTSRSFKNAQPTATAPFAEEYLRELDLRSVEQLTRRAILAFIARESHFELDDELFLLRPFRVMVKMPVRSRISLPANVWVQLGG